MILLVLILFSVIGIPVKAQETSILDSTYNQLSDKTDEEVDNTKQFSDISLTSASPALMQTRSLSATTPAPVSALSAKAGYELADTIEGKGTTDTKIWDYLDLAELQKKYPGYKLTAESIADATTISGDGTAVLNLYYDIDSQVEMKIPSSLSIITEDTLVVDAVYTVDGKTERDKQTWNSTELDTYKGDSIYYTNKYPTGTGNIEIYWSIDGIKVPIEKVTLNGGESKTVTITQPPVCTCTITLNNVKDYSDDIGTNTGVELTSDTIGITATYNTNNCFKHSESGEIPVSFEMKSESGGTVSVSDGKISITDIEKEFTGSFGVSAEKNGIKATDTFKITITRSTKPPVIKEYSYNSKTGKLTLKVSPNGHKKADIYIDGNKVGTVTFKKTLWWYNDTDFTTTVADDVVPNTVKDISAYRDVNDPKTVIISWTDGGDTDNIKKVHAEDGGQKSSTVDVNIKSDSTTKTVNIDYIGSTDGMIELANRQSANSVSIKVSNLHWDSVVYIESFDDALNSSGEVIYKIPNNVIYNPTINDDEVTVGEGNSVNILAKENDIHDPAYSTPLLASVEILNGGEGTATIIDVSQLTDIPSGVEGLIVTFLSKDGALDDVKIRYTYTQVRDDIPAASGIITVHIKQRNQEPRVVDDGVEVTKVLNAMSGTTIDIPASLLLENDYDRETPENLVITQVRSVSSGSITLMNNGEFIRLIPSKLFYGLLKFEYRISDGELVSNGWGTVTIDIQKVPSPPVAMDVKTAMEMSETTKAISLKVENAGGEPYQLESNFNVYVNGSPATSTHGITLKVASVEGDTGELLPYIRLLLSSNSKLKDKDKVTFAYTVYNNYGRSTATITVEMTEGDDPLDMEGYLYVHRRPLAAFAPIIHLDPTRSYVTSVVINGNTELSYDIDHQFMHEKSLPIKSSVGSSYTGGTRPDYSWNGLRAWEWGYKTITGEWTTKVFDAEGKKKEGETSLPGATVNYGTADNARQAGLNWIQSELTSLINRLNSTGKHESIIVSLRVRDIDGDKNIGVWSDQRTVMLTSLPLPPVALFTLDKSTYTVSSNQIKDKFKMAVTDMSYDPNGDAILTWDWELFDGSGTSLLTLNLRPSEMSNDYVSRMVAERIAGIASQSNWNPTSPEFKLSLVVTEDTNDRLPSDKYSVTFNVYKQNEAPIINDNKNALDLNGSTVYEVDNGADGTIGDNWGTETNTNGHPGKINFSGFFNITDDQSLSDLRLSWLFEGETVQRRKDWSEDRRVTTQKAYSNLTYSPFQSPFLNTVTAQGFKPGAYKISVSIKDNPTGNAYPDGAAQTSYWNTYGQPPEAPPYHLYVVPKLDMFTSVEFNGWILSGYFNNAGVWVDTSTRIADGATLAEAGLELEDIVPTIGDTITLRVTTNQYVTNLWGYEDYNQNGTYNAGSEKKFAMTRTNINLDGSRDWEGTFTIDDIDDAPEGSDFTTLNLRMYGDTIWGSETDQVTRTKQVPVPVQVLPVKLYDFRITSITDPNLSDIFDGYVDSLRIAGDKLASGASTDGVLVGHLAIDRNSKAKNVATSIEPLRKGYSYYFSVCSKGLTKDGDEVRIYPKLYAVKFTGNNMQIVEELIGCVPNKHGKYEPYTTENTSPEILDTYELYYEGEKLNSLNTHFDLRIPISNRTIDGSEQTWKGRYGIPADARFFSLNKYEAMGPSSDIEWKGDILVAFDLQAYKDGRSRYNYVERGQWAKERAFINDVLKSSYVTQETSWLNSGKYLGTIAIYDGSKSLRDDYTSNPVWKE